MHDPHGNVSAVASKKTEILGNPDAGVPVLGGLSIGEAAAVCGLTVDALRYYEREGLTLHPLDRNSAGRRRYFERDISWIRALAMLRRTGMRIRDVRAFTELSREEGTEPERLAVLEAHRDRVISKIAGMQVELEQIEGKIEFYRGALPN
jgi:DNA-binding transcriptional MerR regulator